MQDAERVIQKMGLRGGDLRVGLGSDGVMIVVVLDEGPVPATEAQVRIAHDDVLSLYGLLGKWLGSPAMEGSKP